MNFVSRACSEGGSLTLAAMFVWGGVTWLDLTQRPSPGLDLTPRGLGSESVRPHLPRLWRLSRRLVGTKFPSGLASGCSSERLSEPPSELVAFVVAEPIAAARDAKEILLRRTVC